jgi:hypothetical protein
MNMLQLILEEVSGQVQFDDAVSVATFLNKNGDDGLYATPGAQKLDQYLTQTDGLNRSQVFLKLVASPEYIEVKQRLNVTSSDVDFVGYMLREYESGAKGAFCGNGKTMRHFRLNKVADLLR